MGRWVAGAWAGVRGRGWSGGRGWREAGVRVRVRVRGWSGEREGLEHVLVLLTTYYLLHTTYLEHVLVVQVDVDL